MKDPAAPRLDSRSLPAWPAALLLVAVALWLHWPAGAGFKADDFPAIRWASDFGNVVHDFAGPQYGLGFLVLYRPLITLSYAVDHALFGVAPFGFLAMNLAAFVATALLLFAILRMLRPGPGGNLFALCVVLLWVVHPIPVVSLRWVAGRVDTHAAVLVLLALWLHLRLRRGGPRWPVWVAAVAALATKESAFGFPLLALGVDLLDRHPSYRAAPTIGGRALPALPYLLLIPAFLLFRLVVLGRTLGGYSFLAQASFDPIAILQGLRHTTGEALKPGLPAYARTIPALLVVVGIAFWVLRSRHGRGGRALGAVLVAAGLYGPLLQLLPSMRSGDQRFAYLACAGILVVWCALASQVARGRPALTLVLALLPLVWLVPARAARRATMDEHDRFGSRLRAVLVTCDARLRPGEPVVLGGDAELANDPYRFLWGLGSVLKPPFHTPPREVVTLRRLHPAADAAPASLVTEGLAAWVALGRDQWQVRAGLGSESPEAEPIGFDRLLREEDIARLAAGEAFGFRVGADFEGKVAICTSVGSLLVGVPAQGGVLSIPALLLANATESAGGSPLPVLWIVWNALDLAADSPLFLHWREGGRAVRATLRATPAFTRAVREALGG